MWRTRLTLAAWVLVAVGSSAQAASVAEVPHRLSGAEGAEDGKHGDPDPEAEVEPEPASPTPAPASRSICCSGDTEVISVPVYDRSPLPPRGHFRAYLYLGGQSPSHSDGAMTVEARTTYKSLGLGVRATSYFEQLDPKLNTYEHLDVWSLVLLWRTDDVERFNVWLEVGVTGVNDQRGQNTGGLTAGLSWRRPLLGEVSMVGGARLSLFERGVTAGELHAGVKLAILQIAYRIVDLDLGPPLSGPEVGVALTF